MSWIDRQVGEHAERLAAGSPLLDDADKAAAVAACFATIARRGTDGRWLVARRNGLGIWVAGWCRDRADLARTIPADGGTFLVVDVATAVAAP